MSRSAGPLPSPLPSCLSSLFSSFLPPSFFPPFPFPLLHSTPHLPLSPSARFPFCFRQPHPALGSGWCPGWPQATPNGRRALTSDVPSAHCPGWKQRAATGKDRRKLAPDTPPPGSAPASPFPADQHRIPALAHPRDRQRSLKRRSNDHGGGQWDSHAGEPAAMGGRATRPTTSIAEAGNDLRAVSASRGTRISPGRTPRRPSVLVGEVIPAGASGCSRPTSYRSGCHITSLSPACGVSTPGRSASTCCRSSGR